jgi:hypothetical protein
MLIATRLTHRLPLMRCGHYLSGRPTFFRRRRNQVNFRHARCVAASMFRHEGPALFMFELESILLDLLRKLAPLTAIPCRPSVAGWKEAFLGRRSPCENHSQSQKPMWYPSSLHGSNWCRAWRTSIPTARPSERGSCRAPRASRLRLFVATSRRVSMGSNSNIVRLSSTLHFRDSGTWITSSTGLR